jgi:hypothetical protein
MSTSTVTSASTGGTSGDGTTTEEPWSESTGSCSCEGLPIGLDDEVEEGVTPAQLLAGASFVDVELVWYAIAETPATTSSGTTSYHGGIVTDEVGGCCGNFLCIPCPEGVTIGDVSLALSTADGRIQDTFTGSLTGPSEVFVSVDFMSEPVPIGSLTGTLGTETFDADAVPFTPTAISIQVGWGWGDGTPVIETVRVIGHADNDTAILGEDETP